MNDLKQELESRGQTSKGLKSQLQARLQKLLKAGLAIKSHPKKLTTKNVFLGVFGYLKNFYKNPKKFQINKKKKKKKTSKNPLGWFKKKPGFFQPLKAEEDAEGATTGAEPGDDKAAAEKSEVTNIEPVLGIRIR